MKISVVIPLFNKAKYIERTLESVFAQTFSALEVIVVNDCSTDGSAEIVREKFAERVHFIDHDTNGGVSRARNTGIAAAQGEFIAFLDADDIWRPEHLANFRDLRASYPKTHIFCSGYEFFDGVNYSAIRNSHLPKQDGPIEDYFLACCNADLPITSSSVCVTKASLESIGSFPEKLKMGEDQIVWARLSCEEDIVFSHRITVVYDLSASSTMQPAKEPHEPSPHLTFFKSMLKQKQIPKKYEKSLEYLLHLSVLNCVKRNLQDGYKAQAWQVLNSHELLQWDIYRVLAYLCFIFPPFFLSKVFSYARYFR
ncbi:Glycosyl transferase, family 2 [Pseudoalteromonas luteoviolacea B = ATCC 29581]|nr:Glycosyl transferase, family 2 [Pseudoalteromonas luteoviolacea B = ATCC 29581]